MRPWSAVTRKGGSCRLWRPPFAFRNEGKTWIFNLRPNAIFHDGTPITAEAVKLHFDRWVGLPEHAWISASNHIVNITAANDWTLRVELDQPMALLPDLCAINPCSIASPSSYDHQGNFVSPVGSSPYKWTGVSKDKLWITLEGFEKDSKNGIKMRRILPSEKAIDLLRNNEVDCVRNGWNRVLSISEINELTKSPEFDVEHHPGSAVVNLDFRLLGPTADRALRRLINCGLDRNALVNEVMNGLAEPCRSWAAPSVKIWPRAKIRPSSKAVGVIPNLKIVIDDKSTRDRSLACALISQFKKMGLSLTIVRESGKGLAKILESGQWDIRIGQTWGAPYDPDLSLIGRFVPEAGDNTAVKSPQARVPKTFQSLVRSIANEPSEDARRHLYREIQDQLDEESWVVSLFVPFSTVITRKGCDSPRVNHDLYHLTWDSPDGK